MLLNKAKPMGKIYFVIFLSRKFLLKHKLLRVRHFKSKFIERFLKVPTKANKYS